MNIQRYAVIAAIVFALSACKQDQTPAADAAKAPEAAADVVAPAIEGAAGTTEAQKAPPAGDAPPTDPAQAQAAVEAAADEAAKMVEEQAAEAAKQ